MNHFNARRRIWLASLGACLGMLSMGAAQAADPSYPAKPIRIIVPYPPGGIADGTARNFAAGLASRLKGTVVVENRAGASGIIGADAVAKAPADGYTLLFTVVLQLVAQRKDVKVPYDAFKDFRPIVGVSQNPHILVATPGLATNLPDLLKLAKTRKIAYGSYGEGTTTHLLLESLSRERQLDMVHVPYKGEAPVVTDLMGGHVQIGLLSPGAAREHQKNGTLTPLAVAAPKRNEFLPEIPTAAEQGVQGLEWTYGLAVFAPAGVPDKIAERLSAEGMAVTKDPEFQARVRANSNSPWSATPAEVAAQLSLEDKTWKVLTASEK
ncbi:Bug family tripartite tricarboxylate transporter substrate binding protein [Simplicispira suum]|uniref:Tripartite tricarboxylate transporter substrate binding protein n=1 Tax=Simplicispira suum TaxID=2109915 RepID=A0A2S0N0K2_9BURK|nr:tripartite tricarboxylate transporter substrate binding protein [Simplicispira suum]AVO41665.1 tripartite tricarboxylate transporter substrate binding protein [Simplicispira suum]